MRNNTRPFLATALGALALGGILLTGGTGADDVQPVRADEAPVAVTVHTPGIAYINNPWS